MASASHDSWYYLVGDQPTGPVSAEDLRAAVAAGVVGPETLVRHAAWSRWHPATDVPGLLPVTQAALAVPVAPPPVSEPGEEFETFARGMGSAARRTKQAAKSPSGKKSKKGLPVGTAFLLVAAVAGCAVLFWVLWNRPRFGEPPPKPAVAQRAKKPAPKKPEEKPPPEEPTGLGQLPEVNIDPNARPNFGQTAFELATPSVPRGRIDELVFAKLKQLGIEPAYPCSDAVFLRRVYLDVIGTLPTPDEARAFLKDTRPDKRDKLIEALLERPEFADFWAMKWSDLLRVKAEFPINLWPNAAQAYHRWIRNAIKTNMPYDKFVRELLTSSGSNFRVPQVNFYRALQSRDPKGIARAVALTFMGVRAEKWPEERLAGMSAFFLKVGYKPTGEWKEEIVIFDPHKTDPPKPAPEKPGEKKPADKKPADKKAGEKKAKPAPPPDPVFPDGTRVEIAWDKDPREVFADWLITPKNPWFARNIVNRIWYWLQGRGIVHEPDDVRPDNPPSNPELLDYLADELVKANYDLKHIYRLILQSSTYQFSPIPRSKHPEAAVHFASYTVRRL
ncbi:MAG: DUF1549 domain-containing protein, partial [Thermoguttaceae bacterium]|nr:DUF1549 domain-containing protein [Thermoguttaceae bacterium]